MRPRRFVLAALAMAALASPAGARLTEVMGDTAALFACEVDTRLAVPEEERVIYGTRMLQSLVAAGVDITVPQHVLVVDRNPNVQAAFLYRITPGGGTAFSGAVPVSTGQPGTFEHFATPVGVFAHSLDSPDFRAEGTRNENGIRGYGAEGRRVFDFGWVDAPKGWGDHGESVMRLQVHATDPDLLEPQLGRPRSKGCIRIPASLDEFLDRRGILDRDYVAARESGATLWVLREDQEVTRWPGRYLVVVDSLAASRPAWAVPPRRRQARPPECAAP